MSVNRFWGMSDQYDYAYITHAGFFEPQDGRDTFLRNVGSHTDYTALYPRRWQDP
jgi:hypothetical protein